MKYKFQVGDEFDCIWEGAKEPPGWGLNPAGRGTYRCDSVFDDGTGSRWIHVAGTEVLGTVYSQAWSWGTAEAERLWPGIIKYRPRAAAPQLDTTPWRTCKVCAVLPGHRRKHVDGATG